MIEVEIKAVLKNPNISDTVKSLGYLLEEELTETDIYFNASERDFRKTDEALRLRRSGGRTYITYKGPKQDSLSQTRNELETAVEDLDIMKGILTALGYQAIFTVEKSRSRYCLGDITICLDTVKDLGSYIEIETLISEQARKEAAVSRLLSVLDSLKIPRSELTQKSYLELLMASATS